MRLMVCALALALAGCSSSKPAEKQQAPETGLIRKQENPFSAAGKTAPPAAQAEPPKKAPRPKTTKTLGVVGGVTVASYPPTGFDKLSPNERLLAYHLAMAAWAGDPLFYMQTSKYAWPAKLAVKAVLGAKDKVKPELYAKFQEFNRALALHHGIHDARTGKKYAPPMTRAEWAEATKVAGVKADKQLEEGLFNPDVAPNLTNKSPGAGKDPLTASAANHYEGVTGKDLEKFKDAYPLNGRVVKKGGKLVEEVYRAGGDGAKPGLGADVLGRVIHHLEEAKKYAGEKEQESLAHLIRYFKTGDNAEFTAQDVAWVKQVFPVDYILGFVETYSDVRGVKGSFEAWVAIPDPERNPPLQALAQNAAYFEQRMPWDDKWKRQKFDVPAAAAVNVLAATADGGPFTFSGVNLPNAQDFREKYGTKNFVVLSVMDVREELVGEKTIEEFAPAEVRDELKRCGVDLDYAATAFHEVTGHGSGLTNPEITKADPGTVLAPHYSALEEGRAELVADYQSGDPKTVEIGLLPDVGCQRVWGAYKSMSALVRLKYVPTGDTAEEDHMRADLITFGVCKEKGAIKMEVRDGKTYAVVPDQDAWRKCAGELLAEFHRIKATGDKAALTKLVDTYGTKINTQWRDEVLKRLEALGLPRMVATIPPLLAPVADEQGKVVDAKAWQVDDLDKYIEAVEASWK